MPGQLFTYFFLTEGIRQTTAYILDTFSIVRRHEKAAFGRYRTITMILAYCSTFAA